MRFFKKLIITLGRTSVAIAFIVSSFMVFSEAVQWKYWTPENEYGFLMVSLMYLTGMVSLMLGAYGVSPIFWTAIFYATGTGGLTEEEYKKHLNRGRKIIKEMRKLFIW